MEFFAPTQVGSRPYYQLLYQTEMFARDNQSNFFCFFFRVKEKVFNIEPSGLYYNQVVIVNDASSHQNDYSK